MSEPTIKKATIGPLEDIGFVNTAIPGGVIISEADAEFTILQGNDGYFKLIGYTREEVAECFENKGMRTIHPDDAKEALGTFLAQVEGNEQGTFSVKARLIHKEIGYQWVHFTGSLERRPNQRDRVYFLLLDLTEQQEILERLKHEQDFNTLVASLSEDAFFDCDILSGMMRYSKNFAERFGVSELILDYPNAFLELGIVAADSIHFFNNRFLSLSGEIQEEELHLLSPDGTDVWCLCRYNVFHDRIGIPVRAVGKLTDITKQKTRIEELSEKAARDPLTGLYNKSATESLIIGSLQRNALSETKDALIIIDVDNFKDVNDRLGHLYGDFVLAQLAEGLKKLFRSGDILGRIGGDEFFVFLQNYGVVTLLEEKAEEIGKLFRKVFQENIQTVRISASVGIALRPEHGEDFYSLYQNADTALYVAKNHGKDTYAFYEGQVPVSCLDARTEIDSQRYMQKNFKSHRVEYVFELLCGTQDMELSIRIVLKLLVEHFHYSRAYIVEYSNDASHATNTYEWCGPGIQSEQANRQRISLPLEQASARALQDTGIFVLHRLEDLPEGDERSIIAQQGTRAVLRFALKEQGETVGYIGFDDCKKEGAPSPEDLDEMGTICHVLGTFLLRERSMQKAKQKASQMTAILNRLPNPVFVIQPKTHRVLFENASAILLMQEENQGELCFKAYQNRLEPCPNCPMLQVSKREDPVFGTLNGEAFAAWEAQFSLIEWGGTGQACLIHCQCQAANGTATPVKQDYHCISPKV